MVGLGLSEAQQSAWRKVPESLKPHGASLLSARTGAKLRDRNNIPWDNIASHATIQHNTTTQNNKLSISAIRL